MKKKALVAAVLAATTLTATSAFAAQNPFKDVPSDHWAYDAIAMLAQDGILEGYGDGTFNGTKAMNRYEMAEIVSKVVAKYDTARPADKGAIKKLEKEFANELKDMDVRISNLEKDVAGLKGGMKWWGDARIRYFKNKKGNAIAGSTHDGLSSKEYNKSLWRTDDQNELRLRLGLYAEPAENLSVTGQLKAENGNIARSDYDHSHWADGNKEYEHMFVNRLQLDWHAKSGFTVSAGRNELKLGQGLLYWENPIDSVMVKKDFGDKASLLIGAGDSSVATWDSNAGYATFANLSAKVSPAIELTAAYYNEHSDSTVSHKTWNEWSGKRYWSTDRTVQRNLEQVAIGANIALASKWTLIAEGVHNSADVPMTNSQSNADAYGNGSDERNGYWARLMYGHQNWGQGNTWQVYGEYFHLGGLAIDSSGWAHRLNVAGGNGYGGDGAKGWGLGASYMLAKNTNLELTYYKLTPFDKSSAGFDKYEDIGYAALTYSF